METFKTFRKYDVWDMPLILEDHKFKIIIYFVSFIKLKMIKIGRYFINKFHYMLTLI
jgi:hypothetical protein